MPGQRLPRPWRGRCRRPQARRPPHIAENGVPALVGGFEARVILQHFPLPGCFLLKIVGGLAGGIVGLPRLAMTLDGGENRIGRPHRSAGKNGPSLDYSLKRRGWAILHGASRA